MSQAAGLNQDKKAKTYTIVNNKVSSLIAIFQIHLPAHMNEDRKIKIFKAAEEFIEKNTS